MREGRAWSGGMKMEFERRADLEDLGMLVNVGLSVDEEEVRAWSEQQ